MDYPKNLFFDIETLINTAQPSRILLIGDCDAEFLSAYQEQKQLIQQRCEIHTIDCANIEQLWQIDVYEMSLALSIASHYQPARQFMTLNGIWLIYLVLPWVKSLNINKQTNQT